MNGRRAYRRAAECREDKRTSVDGTAPDGYGRGAMSDENETGS